MRPCPPPTACLDAGELGELIGELEVEKARADAVTLAWVRQAETGDIGKTTGAATTATWLRTVQRMSKNEASATVALARYLDRPVTLTARALARGDAFAELMQMTAETAASPKRGRGRDCVTVTIGLDQHINAGFGTIDDTTTARPTPCTCQIPDAKRQANGKKSRPCTSPGAATAGKPTTQPDVDSEPDEAHAGAGGMATTREGQPVREKRPPDPPGPAGIADRIPGPREPGHQPQPNITASGPRARSGPGHRCAPDPEPIIGNPEEAADAEPEKGAAGPEAATEPINDPIDPHDGCQKCGGGGSARILGLRREPISVATIRRMACDANIIPVVLGGNGEILDVGTADRFFTEAQRRALAVRDGSHCHFPDCQVPERRCVAHHMTAWDDFGPTDLANGVLLCKTHHTYVHHKGWQVRMGAHGHPEYVPPEGVDPQQKVRRP